MVFKTILSTRMLVVKDYLFKLPAVRLNKLSYRIADLLDIEVILVDFSKA